MSATAAIEIGSDLWNARVYAGLSVAAELTGGLDRQRHSAFSLFSAWMVFMRYGRLSRNLDEMLKEHDRLLPYSPGVPSERLRMGRDILLQLYANCKSLQTPLDGIPLRGLIAKRLARLQVQSERILDIADWFDAMSDPDEMDARFKALAEDVAEGNYVPLALVQ